jgi:hypothetical protein
MRTVLCGVLLMAAVRATCAQELPNTPQAVKAKACGRKDFSWAYSLGLVCGGGASRSASETRPTAQCGASLRTYFIQYELGIMGPQATTGPVSGYVSVDAWVPFSWKGTKSDRMPYATGGYTRMFQTGNAIDYGAGYGIPLDADHALLIEAKDYWVPSQSQHNVVLRVSWSIGFADD